MKNSWGHILVLWGNAKWPKMLQTFALDGFQWWFSLWFSHWKYLLIELRRDLSEVSILVRVLLSFAGQCQVAKDAQKFCSGWVSILVFTLIFPLKVLAHRLDKGFIIGEYFGKGTFECWWAMPSDQRSSKLLLSMGFSQCFHFDCPLESTASQIWQGFCHRWIFWYGDFWVLWGNAKWPRMLQTFALNGFQSVFSLWLSPWKNRLPNLTRVLS